MSHGRSSNIMTRHSSSPSCSSSSPDIRSNRNGFSTSEVWLVTSFVSTGEAVASHLGRRVAYVPESLGEQLVGLLRTGFCIILNAVSGQSSLFAGPDSSDPKLIADLRRFFAEVGRRVEEAVAPYFPKNEDGTYPWGYLWAITIPCDSCRRRFPQRQFTRAALTSVPRPLEQHRDTALQLAELLFVQS